ncbi:MAG: hypothetical protein SFU86_00315 [Pirellulaceae bacterium]|nr:hypothetical protein [Pirellulaceae bacterium]
MARIFSVLALLALALLAANFVVGLSFGDFNAASQTRRAAGERLDRVTRELRAKRLRTSPELDAAKAEYLAAGRQFESPRGWMKLHMLLGAGAAMLAILVNSITVTYFIGTSRWCKEVCETYRLPVELAERSTRLKRSTFPWALAGILTLILLVGLGAAADPTGANYEQSASFVTIHYVAAIVGLVIVAVSFAVQISRIAANYAVIEEILAAVREIRERKEREAAAAASP